MKGRSDYYEKARGWAADTQMRERRLRRTAWTIAGIAIALALFEAVALAMLMPLKTVQPVTLLVDRQTGYVQALDPLQPRRIGADAALTQSLLAQYVLAREQFDRATISADYRRVALWSAGLARTQYLASMPASNPQSPLQRVPAGVTVTARVKSISPLSTGIALVRFDTLSQDREGRTTQAQPWVSIIRYRYSDAGMSFDDRLINPLGFQVLTYRKDAEAPSPVSQPAPPAPSIVAATSSAGGSRTFSSPDENGAQVRIVSQSRAPMGSPFGPLPKVPTASGAGKP